MEKLFDSMPVQADVGFAWVEPANMRRTRNHPNVVEIHMGNIFATNDRREWFLDLAAGGTVEVDPLHLTALHRLHRS